MDILVSGLFKIPLNRLLGFGSEKEAQRTRKAFEKLVKRGCHPEWLLVLLIRIVHGYRITSSQRRGMPKFARELGLTDRQLRGLVNRLRGFADGIGSFVRLNPVLGGEPLQKGLEVEEALKAFQEALRKRQADFTNFHQRDRDPRQAEGALLDYVKSVTNHQYRDDLANLLAAACGVFMSEDERRRLMPALSGPALLKRQQRTRKGDAARTR